MIKVDCVLYYSVECVEIVKYLNVEEDYENTVACLFEKSTIVVYLI